MPKKKKENSIFSIYDSFGVKLLTCLRLQFSHVNEDKFRHGFGDTINAMRMRKWSWNHWTLSFTLPSLFFAEIRALWKPRKSWLKFFELKSQRKS